MDVIGVVDLRDGQAVHARGGVRAAYAPVQLGGCESGDAVALARHHARCGAGAIYVADLDAIEGRAPQWPVIDALVATGLPLWVDAAVTSPAEVEALRARGVSTVVVGLETLPSLAVLPALVATGADLVLSLDVREGRPLGRVEGAARADGALDPLAIARRAAEAGIGTILWLDLTRVGAGTGVDTTRLAHLRAGLPPHVRLAAGGGLAHPRDLQAAADVGCVAVLVASALLDGRLTAADVHAVNSRR